MDILNVYETIHVYGSELNISLFVPALPIGSYCKIFFVVKSIKAYPTVDE